uniref:Transposase Tnp1/En/Spm-like domain-containing protein n=1 Tax=Cannabis sativa TaxID=3483 RepID=A0A803QD56_CANSA
MFAAMDRYMQYRLAEQDEDSVESFTDLLTNNNDKKNGRGPTQMRDIWGNRDGKKIQITCNKFGQPHDKNASRLANLIGTLVRDGKNAPINYENWHKVPDKYKVTMWRIIQVKRACTSHNKEPRRQLLFSCSSYDTPVVEVGEVVNHKSITNDPKTIAIALVISKDSSKQVGGKELGDFYSEVIVQVPIKCDKQLIRAYRQFKKISEVVGVPIAWPTDFLISEESHTQLDDSIM